MGCVASAEGWDSNDVLDEKHQHERPHQRLHRANDGHDLRVYRMISRPSEGIGGGAFGARPGLGWKKVSLPLLRDFMLLPKAHAEICRPS